jgi:hypothetical protein
MIKTTNQQTKQRNFGRPQEWALVREFPWSAPQLRRIGGGEGGGEGGGGEGQ